MPCVHMVDQAALLCVSKILKSQETFYEKFPTFQIYFVSSIYSFSMTNPWQLLLIQALKGNVGGFEDKCHRRKSLN